MSPLWLIVIVLIVIALFGGVYGYRGGWDGHPYGGYYSGGIGIVGVVLIILVVLLLMGRL